MVAGLKKHGVDVQVQDLNTHVDVDLAIFWGHRRQDIITRQKQIGGDYLVMERGYFRDRFKYTSVGFNGLNGRADFKNRDCPSDRWDRHGVEIKDWNDGEVVLLVGQVNGDASLAGANIESWYRVVAEEAKALGSVVFRPHPKGSPNKFPDCEVSTLSLEQDLARAKCVITYNSNTGVDAILNGVPVIAMDKGSMAWDVAGHEIVPPPQPDRTQWAYNLAYCQWTEEEIRNGDAWEHLK